MNEIGIALDEGTSKETQALLQFSELIGAKTEVLVKLNSSEAYKNSSVLAKLKQQPSENPNIIAVTDIDGTFIKNPDPEGKFLQVSSEIKSKLGKKHIPLIAATGRNMRMITEEQQKNTQGLWDFDLICSCVGTEIKIRQNDGSYLRDNEYRDFIIEQTGWNRENVYTLSQQLIRDLSASSPDLSLQFQPRDTPENVTSWKTNPNGEHPNIDPPEEFKISFYFEATDERREQLVEEVKKRLTEQNVPHTKVVASLSETSDSATKKYNLDLVAVSKSDAVNYLGTYFHSLTVVAGDSGNDTDMILKGGQGGIVVGGASDELVTAIERETTLLRETAHFKTQRTLDGRRMIFIEPDREKSGPVSLQKALHFYELLLGIIGQKRTRQ